MLMNDFALIDWRDVYIKWQKNERSGAVTPMC